MTLTPDSDEAPREEPSDQQPRRSAWRDPLPVWLERGQRALLPLVLLACAEMFRRSLDPKAQVHDWVFWRYPLYWGLAAIWVVACSSAGFAVLSRVLRSPLPLLEHWTQCFAVGLLSFFWLMFVGGVLGLLGPVFFVGILLVLLGSGALPGLRYLRRLRRHLRAARARPRATTPVPVLALWGVGLVALFLFYLPGIVPAQIGYDSAWYHVPLGEHYARLGRIAPTPEGWFAATIPHLPAVVYAFGFLLPGGKLFDYVELSSHLEFAGLLMTLVGIPALVRRLVPGARAHAGWIALFSFPALYWYDSLIGGDEFSAVWAVPIALGLLRTFPELSWRHGMLLAAAIAGETLTKYSASGILIGPALAIAWRICWRTGQSFWQRKSLSVGWQRTSGGLWTGTAVLLLTTPLWLKNWVWYGDPFFPLLHQIFPKSHPWTQDASAFYADYQREMADWQPPPGMPGIKASLLQVATHAFQPADYSPLPFRGALFSMMCACLPFVRARGRLWGIAIVCNLAVFGWYKQLHQDRYLMAFMPAMAAVVVSVAILAWRSSWVSRASVVALFAFHTVFSLGVFALGNPNGHYRRVLDYIQAVANGNPDAGMGDLARWDTIGKSMPKSSKALLHSLHLHAGLGHPSVMDWQRTQAGLSYGRLRSPAAIYAELRRMGVTHLVYSGDSWADDSYAGDLRFFELAEVYSSPKAVGGYWVATLPQNSPPDFAGEQLIAFVGCDGRYAAGLYPFSAMAVPNPRRNAVPPYPTPLEAINDHNAEALLGRARYAIFKGDCGFAGPPQLWTEFRSIGRRDGYTLFVRKD